MTFFEIVLQTASYRVFVQLVSAMSAKLNVDQKLEQDDFEGVDEDEWVGFVFTFFITILNVLYLLSKEQNLRIINYCRVS